MRCNLQNSFTRHFPAKARLPKGKLQRLYAMVLVSDIQVLDFSMVSSSKAVSKPKPYTTFCSQPARERNTILPDVTHYNVFHQTSENSRLAMWPGWSNNNLHDSSMILNRRYKAFNSKHQVKNSRLNHMPLSSQNPWVIMNFHKKMEYSKMNNTDRTSETYYYIISS